MTDARPRCMMCKRLLDQPDVPESLDCGGDCLGCIRESETASRPAPREDES